jgi:hypothetical protein
MDLTDIKRCKGAARFTILAWLCIVCSACIAQEFAIRKIELGTEQLIVHYDLIDTVANHTYSIYAYSSRDNFLSPLEKVVGDVGLEVRPGLNRKLIWNAKDELGQQFAGDVELEIRGRLYVPFIRFEGFKEVEVRKRNVPFLVKWSGGTRQNILNFQLYQGDKLRHTFPNVPNSSEYRLTIPTSVRPGKDYYFKITDTKNKDQVVLTTTFLIRRRYPLALKAFPLALAAGAVAFFWPEPEKDLVSGPPKVPSEK